MPPLFSPLTPLPLRADKAADTHAVFHAHAAAARCATPRRRRFDAALRRHVFFDDDILSFSSSSMLLKMILLFAGFRFRLHDFLEAFSRHATPRRYADSDTMFFAPIFRAPLLFYRLAIAMRFLFFDAAFGFSPFATPTARLAACRYQAAVTLRYGRCPLAADIIFRLADYFAPPAAAAARAMLLFDIAARHFSEARRPPPADFHFLRRRCFHADKILRRYFRIFLRYAGSFRYDSRRR
jgi:hypothetical protein